MVSISGETTPTNLVSIKLYRGFFVFDLNNRLNADGVIASYAANPSGPPADPVTAREEAANIEITEPNSTSLNEVA